MRSHKSDFGATELNPGYGSGRFHPFTDSRGQAVPTLYGSSCLEGALAETVFHGVPIRGRGRYLRSSVLKTYLVSVVMPRRDLRLVQLHGFGLRRLGLSRSELIDSDPSQYERTVRWAAALYAWSQEIDGLVWVSRQYDTSRSLVLFGDRVRREDLEVAEVPLPLGKGIGLKKVQRAAEQAGIAILKS
ncbi:MAG TPA: RES family NAD+ phosphorylase [Thermoanaerobaculia bacterium]|nr:RES family NAD+ phosphorylase [Thermoanaerobaculia bacterium]